MNFFKQFVQNEIEEKQFIENLTELTTKIQKKSTLSLEDITEISSQVKDISDDIYNRNLELFVKFGLYVSNRGVYQLLYEIGFEKLELSKTNNNQNILGLYIIKRVYDSENYKNLIIFLNEILRNQSTIEKKLVLLELFVLILPRIEKREIHLPQTYTIILAAVNEGLMKFMSYKKQQYDNTLNTENQYTKIYMDNFQKWTISFFTRIFDSIRKFPENKTQLTAIKELFSIDSMYDYYEHQLVKKAEDPKLIVKHYTLLFITDLIQGIIQAKQQLQNDQLDPQIIQELLDITNKLLFEIHDNKLELIENYLIWLRFCQQNHIDIPDQYYYYTKEQPYNPVAMCYLVYEVLTKDKLEHILSIQYKLKITIGVLYQQTKLKNAKCDIQTKIIDLIVKYLQQDIKQYSTSSYYLTQFDIILLQLMERAGSGLENEKPYINAHLKCQENFNQVWPRIIEKCIIKSQNQQLLAYLINRYRSFMTHKDINEMLNAYNIIIPTIFNKELGQIEFKMLLFDAAYLLMNQIIKKGIKKEQILNWIPYLDKSEKEFQQAIDYIEQKKNQKDEQETKSDMALQGLITNESMIRIAYYNLQNVKNALKEL